LEQLLKRKQRQKDEAMHMQDTQRLIAEIEMLKVVLYLVCRKYRKKSEREGKREEEKEENKRAKKDAAKD
jgi:hypothetical protein